MHVSILAALDVTQRRYCTPREPAECGADSTTCQSNMSEDKQQVGDNQGYQRWYAHINRTLACELPQLVAVIHRSDPLSLDQVAADYGDRGELSN